MEWISCKNQSAPKNGKFLFHYHQGIGLGEWSSTYEHSNGDSWLTNVQKYLLIIWPSDILHGDSPFEWDEGFMIDMDVKWMPLPNPPV